MQVQAAVKEKARKAQPVIETPTLYALARETLRETGNDADAAEAVLLGRLLDDRELLRALVAHAVKTSVNVTVACVLGNQRAKAFNSVANIERAKIAANGLAKAMKSALLDMPLADGTRLRDATAFEITETAERWEKVSATMAHRARWLRMVAEKLPTGRRCGEVLSEAKALALFNSAA